MKKFLIFLIALFITATMYGQQKYDLVIEKAAPMVYLNGTGGVLKFQGNILLTQSAGALTLSNANLSLGANSLLGTGSIGASGAGKMLKGWFTNLEATNYPTVNGTSIATLFAPISNPTFTTGITTPAIVLGATTINATGTQINYLNTTTSNVQTQLNTKAPIDNPTFTTRITTPALTLGSTAITSTPAQLNYLNTTTSDVQTQLNSKAAIENPLFTTAITTPSLILTSTPVVATADELNILHNLEPNLKYIGDVAILTAQVIAALTDNTPTNAEITSALGMTAAVAGANYTRIIKDSDGSGLIYQVFSDGTSWHYIKSTIAQ